MFMKKYNPASIGNIPPIIVLDPLPLFMHSVGLSFSGIWSHTAFIKLETDKSWIASEEFYYSKNKLH